MAPTASRPRQPVSMPLSYPLRAALENLHRKNSGVTVDWINIADARALTELGFARRSHQGWLITEAGQEAHRAQPQAHDIEDGPGRVVDYP
jgi:hypothetical protein